jgi:major vault protein
MASKVRGAVAGVPFEDFHKNSARLIRKSIFGTDEKGKIKDEFAFPKNNLVVTNVDIQNVEPVDEKTKVSLQKSVTLAIEISTSSLEQNAKYQSDKFEQQAKGQLLKLKIEADSRAEEARQKLLQVQAECQSIKNQGQAKAEARARAKAEEIECNTVINHL